MSIGDLKKGGTGAPLKGASGVLINDCACADCKSATTPATMAITITGVTENSGCYDCLHGGGQQLEGKWVQAPGPSPLTGTLLPYAASGANRCRYSAVIPATAGQMATYTDGEGDCPGDDNRIDTIDLDYFVVNTSFADYATLGYIPITVTLVFDSMLVTCAPWYGNLKWFYVEHAPTLDGGKIKCLEEWNESNGNNADDEFDWGGYGGTLAIVPARSR